MNDEMTEREKMAAGLDYYDMDPELSAMRNRARKLLRDFNRSDFLEGDGPNPVLKELLGTMADGVFIEMPFHCAYGVNLHLGENVYFNAGCAILDCADVRVGANSMFGPAVQIYTATHAFDPVERASGRESAQPITIGHDVWVGGGAILCPGVTIGDNAVIGAGSVVTKDIPANVVAVGNPCRVVRELEIG
ncbi:sugar O-acetyltransferase [Denitrobaculum tricleocarpae]|nr:sugar O-acetyltransferase [Denitrobaculum tricleocarpae]